ncbi:MAG: hypothetical protein JO141_28240 [Bradyrhizobium sp.]|nr:hypothetical protein [Bradyrhizobium sp.]
MTSVKTILLVLGLFGLAAKISVQSGRHLHVAAATGDPFLTIFTVGTAAQNFLAVAVGSGHTRSSSS